MIKAAPKEGNFCPSQQVEIDDREEVLASPKTLKPLLIGNVAGNNASKSESRTRSDTRELRSSGIIEQPLCSELIKEL